MNTIIINKKTVTIKPIDFSAICALEDLGFDVTKVGSKTFSSLRSSVAFHMGVTLEEASAEIEAHVNNGGKINDFVPLLESITQSDFFQSLAQNTEEEE